MRTRFLSLGAALTAAFVLSSCNTEEAFVPTPDPSTEGTPFEISTILTKTTNDGLSTKWAADDAINLFHAEAGSTTYVSDSKFTVDEGLVGNFSGTLNGNLEEGKSYDWYAFYPYTEKIITPANTKGGYAYIGGRSDKAQTQDGNDSKEHLAGSNCPLYGVAKGVASTDKPSLAMQQLASVVAVKVTNALDNDLIVSNVSFTSTEDITGQYYIDFSKETPDYNATTYVSKTANLTVTGGTAIAKGNSAVFYIAIKPHTAASGSTLTLSVNSAEKTVTLTKDVTFTAGHIKTLTYNYTEAVDHVTLPWSIDGTGGSEIWKNTVGLSQSGLGTDYNTKNHSPYLTKLDTDDDYVQIKYDSPASSVKFGVKMIGGKTTSYISIQGSADGSSFNEIEKFTISGAQNDILSFKTSNTIDSEYRYIRLVFTRGSNVGLGAVEISDSYPAFVCNDINNISARGLSEQVLSYSILYPVDGATIAADCDGSIVTSVVVTDDVITYDVSKNLSSNREGFITLTYSKDGNTLTEKKVAIQQLSSVFKVSSDKMELSADEGATTTLTLSSDFDWIAELSEGAAFTISPDTYTWDTTSKGQETVTIKASSTNTSETGTITLGTITFTNVETNTTIEVIVTQKSSYIEKQVTFTFSGGAGQKDGLTWTTDPISIIANTGTGSIAPNEHAKNTELRFYAGNTLSISGATITKVEFNGTVTKLSANVGTMASDNKSWSGSTDALIITNSDSSQSKFKTITVTYK